MTALCCSTRVVPCVFRGESYHSARAEASRQGLVQERTGLGALVLKPCAIAHAQGVQTLSPPFLSSGKEPVIVVVQQKRGLLQPFPLPVRLAVFET
jgi:hypothetical protein